jgi:carbonic anhydrase
MKRIGRLERWLDAATTGLSEESKQGTTSRLVLLICVVTICACGGTGHPAQEHSAGHEPAPGGHGPRTAHWDYGEDGPSRWAELSPDYALCAEGSSQSPIDLAIPELGEPGLARIQIKMTAGVLAFNEHVEDIVDNGHSIQVSFDDSSVIDLEGVEYELEQFHFHTPSEHTVNGTRFPMEMHFVHQSASGQFLVAGVFIDEGEHNRAFDHLVSNLPGRGESRHVEKIETSLEEMAPGGALAYRYIGSLTTPPCLEEVTWLISHQPLEMSGKQLESFASRMGHNARPIQPVNGRVLSAIRFVEDLSQ